MVGNISYLYNGERQITTVYKIVEISPKTIVLIVASCAFFAKNTLTSSELKV